MPFFIAMPEMFRRFTICALSPSAPFQRTKATRPAPVALQLLVASIVDPAGHFAAAGATVVGAVEAVPSLFLLHPVSARGAASPSASTIAVVFEPFMAADGTAGA